MFVVFCTSVMEVSLTQNKWYVCGELPGVGVWMRGGAVGWCHTFFVTYLRGSKILTRREFEIGGGGAMGVIKHFGESKENIPAHPPLPKQHTHVPPPNNK